MWSWAEHWTRGIEEALSELERETHVRTRCFDRWVSDGKMSRVEATDRLERLMSAIRLLRQFEELMKKGIEATANETSQLSY